MLTGRRYFQGCYVTLTCLRAGLTIHPECLVDSREAPELASHPAVFTSGQHEGMIHVEAAAAAFYNVGHATIDKLSCATNSLAMLKWHVGNIFGADPTV